MTSAPIQYDLSTGGGDSAAYEGTPGPEKAREAGDYKRNTGGLKKITFFLQDFRRPTPIIDPRW